MILLAPTEGKLREILQGQENVPWKTSSLPEQHGCDLFIPTVKGIVGFQRKTLPDLVSSLQDGRLYYELNQLVASATVAYSFLVIESSFDTTIDGDYYTEANLPVGTLLSIVAKFYANGTGFLPAPSPTGTIRTCLSVSSYLARGSADFIHRTKNTTNEWGQTDSKSYGVFLLQSFPGVGPKLAAAIYDHFQGVPLTWSVSEATLAQVPGIGRKKAEALISAVAPLPAVASSGRAAGPQTPG